MNEKILKAYASAPKTWIWKLLAAFGVACLLAWSGSAVRVSNPTGNGLERRIGERMAYLRSLHEQGGAPPEGKD